jgi:enoyl-CoA hydratase
MAGYSNSRIGTGIDKALEVAMLKEPSYLWAKALHLVSARVDEMFEDLKHLRYTERDRIALLTVDRPEVHNAIGLTTIPEFARVLDHLENSSELAALVLTGGGDRTFVSGGDLKELEQLTTHEAAAAMSREMQTLMHRLSALPIPVIGAINGDSFGGGCEVALACDIRIASSQSRFAFKQVTIGITPAWGGRSRLVKLVGRSVALRLLLTGEVIDANEAMRLRLVDRVVGPGAVVNYAMELARQIAMNPGGAVRAIKHQVNHGENLEGQAAVDFEADSFARTWISDDHLKAVTAWKHRRSG